MTMIGLEYFLLCAVIIHICHFCSGDDVIINTDVGKLRGTRTYVEGQSIIQFLGVPYAHPPVGDFRFKKPVKLDAWSDIKDATKYGPSCMQGLDFVDPRSFLTNKDLSEDCLHLQVYVPGTIISKSETPKSVMIWIHGGGYLWGQGTLYDGSKLALKGDVIVITINYRVSVFGFLSTGDSAAAGNYGLWDQRLAIEWVKDNIRHFGGDPASITLFGFSAGAASIGIQMISPVNHGLFKRAITQSGSMFCPWALQREPLSLAVAIGKDVGCLNNTDNIDTRSFVDCLRKINAKDLADAGDSRGIPLVSRVNEFSFFGLFAPVVDGEFLPDFPERLLSDPRSLSYKGFADIDLMAGVVPAEGVNPTVQLLALQKTLQFDINMGIPFNIMCDHLVPVIVEDYFDKRPGIADAICEEYNKNGINNLKDQSLRVIDMFGDFYFVAPTVAALDIHSVSWSATYSYLFSHESAHLFITYPVDWIKAAKHGEELAFIFGFGNLYPANFTVSDDEILLSEKMMDLWSNFAKYGNPNIHGQADWKPYSPHNRAYVNIRADKPFLNMEKNLFDDRMQFWLQTLPEMVKRTKEEL